MTVRFALIAATAILFAQPGLADRQDRRWETPYERSGGTRTPDLARTEQFCRRLAHASPSVHFTSFGRSPQGRRLPLLIISSDHAFDAPRAHKTGKAIVLIQSGIHAGEIDGKDASLLLVRDLVIYHRYPRLLDHAILLFVPVFNVDGHERSGPFNRINQNGPAEMGWRTTAQNLNLNRDYMKADAPEMRAMLKLFAAWMPDLLVDCHVTDGIDFQYDVTYAVEYGANIDSGVSSWLTQRLLPTALDTLAATGHKAFYYVFPREDRDLSKGLTAGASTPRFSTGYAALQNRPAVLIETHMLKPYRTRVDATYEFLVGILAGVNASYRELRAVVHAADLRTIAAGAGDGDATLPLRFGLGPHVHMKEFLGVEAVTESSAVSGGTTVRYTGRPVTSQVPFFDEVTVEDSAIVPAAYCVPPEWGTVLEVLRSHGIEGKPLRHPLNADVVVDQFSSVRFAPRSYEGRQTVTFHTDEHRENVTLPRGTMVFPTDQRTGKVLMNLLEPGAPDALVGWGFFNAIFEQKEYAESYVMERVADSLFTVDQALRATYWEAVRTDTTMARSPGARLNWIYSHSPWRDRLQNRYPVERIMRKDDRATVMRATR